MARRLVGEALYRFKKDGTINAGGSVTFKTAGTSTDKDTFNDFSLSTANANPVILDSQGYADNTTGEIYAEAGAYDIESFDSTSVSQKTVSNWTDDIIAATSGADGFNINGSFESTTNNLPDNWTLSPFSGGTVAIDTAAQGDGENSLKFTSIGSGGGTADSLLLAIPQGLREFDLSWVMISSVVDIRNDVDVLWYDKSKTQLTLDDASTSAYSEATANPTSWAKKSAIITPPSTAYWGKIRLTGGHSSDVTAGNTNFDNVVMRINPFSISLFPGIVERPEFTRASTTTLTISAGMYNHSGTSEQLTYWDSLLTFTPGSAGSNSASTDLGASEIHYLYIDNSAVATLGSDLLTASEFINTTTAPVWSEVKHGWYNNVSDRCIFSFSTDGSNLINEFFHSGDFVAFGDRIEDLAATDIDTTWTDVTLSIPAFSKRADVNFTCNDSAEIFYWRTNGQSGTSGHVAVYTTGFTSLTNSTTVVTDSSQIIEVVAVSSDASTLNINTNGWYMPRGM